MDKSEKRKQHRKIEAHEFILRTFSSATARDSNPGFGPWLVVAFYAPYLSEAVATARDKPPRCVAYHMPP